MQTRTAATLVPFVVAAILVASFAQGVSAETFCSSRTSRSICTTSTNCVWLSTATQGQHCRPPCSSYDSSRDSCEEWAHCMWTYGNATRDADAPVGPLCQRLCDTYGTDSQTCPTSTGFCELFGSKCRTNCSRWDSLDYPEGQSVSCPRRSCLAFEASHTCIPACQIRTTVMSTCLADAECDWIENQCQTRCGVYGATSDAAKVCPWYCAPSADNTRCDESPCSFNSATASCEGPCRRSMPGPQQRCVLNCSARLRGACTSDEGCRWSTVNETCVPDCGAFGTTVVCDVHENFCERRRNPQGSMVCVEVQDVCGYMDADDCNATTGCQWFESEKSSPLRGRRFPCYPRCDQRYDECSGMCKITGAFSTGACAVLCNILEAPVNPPARCDCPSTFTESHDTCFENCATHRNCNENDNCIQTAWQTTSCTADSCHTRPSSMCAALTRCSLPMWPSNETTRSLTCVAECNLVSTTACPNYPDCFLYRQPGSSLDRCMYRCSLFTNETCDAHSSGECEPTPSLLADAQCVPSCSRATTASSCRAQNGRSGYSCLWWNGTCTIGCEAYRALGLASACPAHCTTRTFIHDSLSETVQDCFFECSSATDERQCQDTGCQWDSSRGVCSRTCDELTENECTTEPHCTLVTGGVSPRCVTNCSLLNTTLSCNAPSNCRFNTDAPAGQQCRVVCDRFSANECPTDTCTRTMTTSPSVHLQCVDRCLGLGQRACESETAFGQCNWLITGNETSAEATSCRTMCRDFTQTPTCPSHCLPKDPSVARCSDNCSIMTQTACRQSSQCAWISATVGCVQRCNDISNATVCGSHEHCLWRVSWAGNWECALKNCSSIPFSNDCGGTKSSECTWEFNSWSCVTRCRGRNSAQCPLDECLRTNSTSTLQNDQCTERCALWDGDRTECNRRNACEFQQSNGRCHLRCSSLNRAACDQPALADRCEQSPTSWTACLTRCENFTDAAACRSTDDCLWSTTAGVCSRNNCTSLGPSACITNPGCYYTTRSLSCQRTCESRTGTSLSCTGSFECEEFAPSNGTERNCTLRCSLFTRGQCPLDYGCELGPDLSGPGRCVHNCSRYTTESECFAFVDLCTWNGTECRANVYFTTTAVPPVFTFPPPPPTGFITSPPSGPGAPPSVPGVPVGTDGCPFQLWAVRISVVLSGTESIFEALLSSNAAGVREALLADVTSVLSGIEGDCGVRSISVDAVTVGSLHANITVNTYIDGETIRMLMNSAVVSNPTAAFTETRALFASSLPTGTTDTSFGVQAITFIGASPVDGASLLARPLLSLATLLLAAAFALVVGGQL